MEIPSVSSVYSFFVVISTYHTHPLPGQKMNPANIWYSGSNKYNAKHAHKIAPFKHTVNKGFERQTDKERTSRWQVCIPIEFIRQYYRIPFTCKILSTIQCKTARLMSIQFCDIRQ